MSLGFSVLQEAWATARAQWLSSLAGAAIVAGMCAAMVLTQGAVAATRAEITSSLHSEASRSIIVRAQADAGIGYDVLDRLASLDNISSALAFGAAVDVTNVGLPGGERVGMRTVGGMDVRGYGIYDPGIDASVYVTKSAASVLGLDTGAGAVTDGGVEYPVAGVLSLPESLEMLEPVALLPTTGRAAGTIAVLVVLCDRFESVEGVVSALVPILDAATPASYTIETTGALIELAETIAVQTSPGFQAITIGVFSVTAILVALLLTVLVTLRRRDFGRRRALGASQTYVGSLVLVQGFIISAFGAVGGSLAASIISAITGQATPPAGYVLGVAVLATIGGTCSSFLPALIAAKRDPARELRTP